MYRYNASALRVIDGDTVDAMVDLGFSVWEKKRIRLYGIDAPETRTRNLEEKARGFQTKERLVELLEKSEICTLLILEMQLKLKTCNKITVQPMWEEDFLNLDMIGNKFKHIMIDELPGDISTLKRDYHQNLLQYQIKKVFLIKIFI